MYRWEAWGEQTGFPRSLEEEGAFLQGFWDTIGQTFGLTQDQTDQLHQIDYTDYIRAFPDALPAINAVRRAGLQVGVLSNFSLASLDASLEAAGFAGMIDVACAATVIGVSKPSPEAYLLTAERLRVPPERCIFVDDESICVAGAEQVGMRAYQVRREQKPHKGRIVRENSQIVISDLSVLRQIIQQ
jgi:putative hydrolase of the HAD superfamily